MRIDDYMATIGIGSVVAAVVGGFGAYLIRPIVQSISPVGVALTCAITTAVGLAVLFSDLNFNGKFVGFMAAYPIGLVVSNLIGRSVRFIDPAIAVFVSGIFLTPMVVTALFLATVCS